SPDQWAGWAPIRPSIDGSRGRYRRGTHCLEGASRMTNRPVRAVVLVVDDEATIRESLAMILEFEGYRVETAASGSEALVKLATVEPDAVLLDVKMPEMDGLAVLAAMRERGYQTPVVVISGHADFETAVEAT